MTAGDGSPLTPAAVSGADRPPSPCVHYERRGHVLVIRMEREAKRNAIDRAMTHGIDEAGRATDSGPAVQALLGTQGVR